MKSPVVPDTGLWEQAAGLITAAGGLQAVALLAVTAGLVLGAGAWALGHAGGMNRLATRGRITVIGCLVGAFAIGALPRLIPWVIAAMSA